MRTERMPSLLSCLRLGWVAGALGVSLVACTEEPDVVAYALDKDKPTSDAGTDAAQLDASEIDPCDPIEVLERAHIPVKLVLDLYMMNCKLPLSDFMSPRDEAMISQEEFSKLLNAHRLEPQNGISASVFCDPLTGGYYFEPWNKPKWLVLCPSTCQRAMDFVSDQLAQNGCTESFDEDAGTN